MSTAAQITANRANAQHSTGPSSVEGKAAASRNALKFGIHAKSLVIPGEDPEELEQLTEEYQRDLAPVGAIETTLAETVIRSAWFMRRVARIEAEVVHARLAARENQGPCALGEIYIEDAATGKLFDSLARRYQALQRHYYRALKELRELRQARPQAATFASMARQSIGTPAVTAPLPENRLRFSGSSSTPSLAHAQFRNPALRRLQEAVEPSSSNSALLETSGR
jgi:ribosomal protein L17